MEGEEEMTLTQQEEGAMCLDKIGQWVVFFLLLIAFKQFLFQTTLHSKAVCFFVLIETSELFGDLCPNESKNLIETSYLKKRLEACHV